MRVSIPSGPGPYRGRGFDPWGVSIPDDAGVSIPLGFDPTVPGVGVSIPDRPAIQITAPVSKVAS